MASQAGREVRGSNLAFIPRKKEKRGLSHVQEPVTLTHLENTQEGTMIAMRLLHTESGTEKSGVNLGT